MVKDISKFEKKGKAFKYGTDIVWRTTDELLWLKFKGVEFAFQDAREIVYQISNSKEVKFTSKILNKLEDEGYLIHTRAEYDKRVNIYRSLNPEKIKEARAVFGIRQISGAPECVSKIAEDANRLAGWNYMYIKDSAVWFWSRHYRSTEVFHLSVPSKDADGWVALFKLFNYPLVLNGKFVHEPKAKQQAVHIHADFESRKDQTGEMREHYPPVQYAITECFTDNDNLGALAVLIRNREEIDWDKLATAAENYGVINRLGFSMEAVNRDSGREVFSRDAMEKIEARKRPRVEKIGAPAELEPYMNAVYADLERKWNVECGDASSLKKAVQDLV